MVGLSWAAASGAQGVQSEGSGLGSGRRPRGESVRTPLITDKAFLRSNDTSNGRLEPDQMASARNPWRHAESASGPVRGAALDI